MDAIMKGRTGPRRPQISKGKLWRETRRMLWLLVGTALAAFGYAVFQVPHNLAAGGIGGVGPIVNEYTGWPVGL